MKTNRITITIAIAFAISTALLMASVISLADEKVEHHAIMADLDSQVRHLQNNISDYETLLSTEKEQRAFRDFRENVYRLRFPKFAKTVQLVFRKSHEYGFNPYLVMGLIQVESGFKRYAVSTAGAYGLMQVNYTVWKEELGIDFNRIFDAEYNIDLGLRILKQYYQKSRGNMLLALFRYNNGYKYKNTGYSAKIAATHFYANRYKARKQG